MYTELVLVCNNLIKIMNILGNGFIIALCSYSNTCKALIWMWEMFYASFMYNRIKYNCRIIIITHHQTILLLSM